MNRNRLTLAQKNAWKGFAFTLPFCIGFLLFFLRPFLQSFSFVFSKVTVETGGYAQEFTRLDNLKYVFTVDANYGTNLLTSLKNLLWQVPVILIASLFFSIIINQKFHGRVLVRAIFFLPVIVASGVVIKVIQSDAAAANTLSGNIVAGGDVTPNTGLLDLLASFNLNESVSTYLSTIISNLFNIVWSTGIQMIIFLAGLQSIPSTLYEASAVEGATAWEDFWKITVPMLMPMILVNTVYTIIDSFTSASNAVMLQVANNSNMMRLGWAAAMAWVYFLLMAAVLALVVLVFSLSSNDRVPSERKTGRRMQRRKGAV